MWIVPHYIQNHIADQGQPQPCMCYYCHQTVCGSGLPYSIFFENLCHLCFSAAHRNPRSILSSPIMPAMQYYGCRIKSRVYQISYMHINPYERTKRMPHSCNREKSLCIQAICMLLLAFRFGRADSLNSVGCCYYESTSMYFRKLHFYLWYVRNQG